MPADIRIITDENVAASWGHTFPPGVPTLALSPGEKSKSLDVYGKSLSWLYETGAHRQTAVVAFGGGVVGDLAGFVAATYMRGVPCIQAPTTLLAQVDSSVGGKVAIDLPEGKNLAGAFYPPSQVLICPETLATLPPREFTNGMAEVWKYGYALDSGLLETLRAEPLGVASVNLSEVIAHCIELKAAVVEKDEYDLSGRRAILNFGHTVGHALEKLDGYENLLHGEAVAIGMVVEAAIGERLQITPKGASQTVLRDLQSAGLPVDHPLLRSDSLIDAMRGDKKAEAGNLAFSLLEDIGRCKLVRNVPAAEVAAALSIV